MNIKSAPPADIRNLETRLLLDSSFWTSILQLALVAAATAFFIHWWSLAWFIFMASAVCFRGNTNGQLEVPHGVFGIIALSISTIVFVSAWAGSWIVGGPEAGFVAGILIGSHGLFSTTLFSSSRSNFIAHYGTMLVVAVSVPFLIFDHSVPILIVLLCLTQDAIATWNARKNRNQHLDEMLNIQAEMRETRDASLAKSQFLATMSHELRTPLNAIIGYAEILEEDLSDNERAPRPEDAVRIQRSARNLLALINDVLDFSTIETGRISLHCEDVDVAKIIDEVAQAVAHLTEAHGIAVQIDIAPEARAIRTDGGRLRQCLLNLVSNAAKFTEGGSINVRATVETCADENMLRLDVSDSGCGISEVDKARLFQPFTQLDDSLTRKKDGSGLGLVITKRLSELMGGSVEFESCENIGSTFTLRVRDQTPRSMEFQHNDHAH